MSTTMPCSSSVSARNATRMTKGPPCSFWAGPNPSPRKEWAIMIWSDTSTAYTRDLSSGGGAGRRITDQLADDIGLGIEDRGQIRRQILEGHRRRDQPIERRVGGERDGRRQATPERPTRTMRRRDLTDLARHELEAAAVECFAERNGDLAAAVPAQPPD